MILSKPFFVTLLRGLRILAHILSTQTSIIANNAFIFLLTNPFLALS